MNYSEISTKRLTKELGEFQAAPPVGIRITPSDKLYKWSAEIDGPDGSPYEKGIFKFEIKFPNNYPFVAPEVKCLTRLYHCNINTIGNVCIDLLKTKWTPLLTMSSILLSIRQLLLEPNPNDPLMPSVAKMFNEDKAQHDKIATLYTRKYATERKEKKTPKTRSAKKAEKKAAARF